MIYEILTVMRKELRELFGDPYARRGALVQASVLVVALGILLPWSSPGAWIAADPKAVLFFLLFPGMVSSTVAADGFAGEQERKTLETLLATPLSDRGILFGKAAAAFVMGAGMGIVGFIAAVVSVSVAGAGAFIPAPVVVLGALFGAAASAAVLTAISILVSLRIPVARSAQQTTSILAGLVFAGVSMTWSSLGLVLTWRSLVATELTLAVLALLLLELARARFRRERFFDRR